MRITLDDLSEDLKQSWIKGLEHFNNHEFWEAHEAWEDVWHVLQDNRHLYIQGLIQAAAALVHWQKNNPYGCESLAQKALSKLNLYDKESPVDLRELILQLHEMSQGGHLTGQPVKLFDQTNAER